MSKNIIIRNLSEDQQYKLDVLRDHFYENTYSKTVLRLINDFGTLQSECKNLKQEKNNLKAENAKYMSFFRRIESEVDEINLSNEDSEDMY